MLDNERVRVLDYRDLPGELTIEHSHPEFVLYVLAPFDRELTLADGKILKRHFDAGDVMYSLAQTHIGHNVGTTPTQVLMVELKSGDETSPAELLEDVHRGTSNGGVDSASRQKGGPANSTCRTCWCIRRQARDRHVARRLRAHGSERDRPS